MREYSKKIKKLIREFAAEAHERELHRELTKLELRFAEWIVRKPSQSSRWTSRLSESGFER
jgi:hypothetical protein